MRQPCALLLAALSGISLTTDTPRAAPLAPPLARTLAQAPADSAIDALFFLDGRVDAPGLRRSLRAGGADRAQAHQAVVSSLRDVASRSQAPFLATLERLRKAGVDLDWRAYWITNVVLVRGTAATLALLAERADVDAVEGTFEPELIPPIRGAASPRAHPSTVSTTPGLVAVRADRVWHSLGVTGAGAIVANIDTGVHPNHPALRSRWRGRHAAASACWRGYGLGDPTVPHDEHGHGTHVMGTMCGLSEDTSDTIGVAWGAEWIAANPLVLPNGRRLDNAVIDAFQWLADPDGDPATNDDVPDVVQNSWGVSPGEAGGYSWCDERWWEAIDNCEAAGVVVTFSAGNEGPAYSTILSPASRATTPTNAFAIGAVDATNWDWPYPIADFSSRGPTHCLPFDIKPEVVAPGKDVYSSVPIGLPPYDAWSGTSMAGPHVAGIVALMRSVDPDLDPDTIKEILMDTARPLAEGVAESEDNVFGHGLVDAWGAVLAAGANRGRVRGRVVFADDSNRGVGSAVVSVVATATSWTTSGTGWFGGYLPAGTYDLVVSHPWLGEAHIAGVVVRVGEVQEVTLPLSDTLPPRIERFSVQSSLRSPGDSLRVEARVADWGLLSAADLRFRIGGGEWRVLSLLGAGTTRPDFIRDRRAGDRLDYYLECVDLAGNAATSPEAGADEPFSVTVREAALLDNAATNQGWTFGLPGEEDIGRWIRMVPYGSWVQGRMLEPDHDAGGDGFCFVTGRGKPDVLPEQADVDHTVTLLGPVLDLSSFDSAILSYARWFAMEGGALDGRLTIEATADGSNWQLIEELTSADPRWVERSLDLTRFVPLGSAVQLRIVAADEGAETLLEAAIDQVKLEGMSRPEPPAPVERALTVGPNPFAGRTILRYALREPGRVICEIYDATGRSVRTLMDRVEEAGEHTAVWTGDGDDGAPLPAGLYVARFETASGVIEKKILRVP